METTVTSFAVAVEPFAPLLLVLFIVLTAAYLVQVGVSMLTGR